jgi:hypothetical protein
MSVAEAAAGSKVATHGCLILFQVRQSQEVSNIYKESVSWSSN